MNRLFIMSSTTDLISSQTIVTSIADTNLNQHLDGVQHDQDSVQLHDKQQEEDQYPDHKDTKEEQLQLHDHEQQHLLQQQQQQEEQLPQTQHQQEQQQEQQQNNQQQQQLRQQLLLPLLQLLNPASATNGGREISNRILYVGALPKTVSEELIKELFQTAGAIVSIKLLNDKNRPGFNYAFIEFENPQHAEIALTNLNGKIINNSEIKINWAYQSSTINSTQNPNELIYNIFVGDLSPEVDDETLFNAFEKFQSLKQAHVMWDMQTSRSRGYGFVTFANQQDAELALQTMNGEWISGRAIRCNWASHRQMNNGMMQQQQQHHNGNQNQPNQRRRMINPRINNQNNPNVQNQKQHYMFNNSPDLSQSTNINHQTNLIQQQHHQHQQHQQHQHQHQHQQQHQQHQQHQQQQHHQSGIQQQLNQNLNHGNSNGNNPIMSPQLYDIVIRQTPSWQTTVYLGNIAHFTQQSDLIPLLQNFGFIVNFKFHPERGCAFVKYDSHERAALAIVQLAGFNINGRPLKCGWGKDRPPVGQYQSFRVPQMYRQ